MPQALQWGSRRITYGPPMRFPPHILDDIRARLPVSSVVGRRVALKKAGREWKGLSPFKTERTPSFTVNDQKGFYKCFASGEYGDIFTFVMKTEGLSFTEAVERLAADAGVILPKPEPRSQRAIEEVDARARLMALVEASARFFETQLASSPGQEARRYLERRGVSRETIARFRMGFAPAGREVLKAHLAKEGFTVKEMAEAGMVISGDDIAVPYDRFRNRVMFPIEDLKGRVIAFGGRALDPDAPAKYLNSPETPLFHKGNQLYNIHRARPVAFETSRIVVVEGYMDVVALDQAGFQAAVAPLGTALTEAQVQLLWRVVPEPTLCFDGDGAGQRAAYRAVDTILPLLKPGYSARFAFLTDGQDPDDLVRQQGAAAFEAILTRTKALFDVMWERELATQPVATPEQRAAFEQKMRALVGRIGDASVRGHYEQEVRQTLFSLNRAVLRELGSGHGGGARRTAGRQNNVQTDWRVRERARLQHKGRPATPALPVPSSALAARLAALPAREALILKALINHPWLIEEHAEQIATLEFTVPALVELKDAVLAALAEEIPLDSVGLHNHLSGTGLSHVVALVERAITHKGDRFAEPEADKDAVETGWCHAVALHERQVGLRRDLVVAEQRWLEEQSEDAFQRLCEIKARQNQVEDGETGREERTALPTGRV
ncbi:MAG TPA: DNA primase [Hyphomicrobiaceae bacterium]|nr:DNA primase [Hyphomicrobiaceae bacterium]